MGFPLEIETNSPAVIQALRKSWDMFPQQFAEEPVRMSVGVIECETPAAPQAPVIRSRFNLISIVSDAGNFLVGDFNAATIFGWLTTAALRDESFCRFHFLDVSVLTVLQQRYLAPIHASLVARSGKGVVFCGNSAAGKSTLAYACARSGWTYVSDDATYMLQNEPHRYAIGNSHVIHFRDSARALFPELDGCISFTRPNGKFGMQADTRNLPIASAPGAPIEHMIFLNRNDSTVPMLTRSDSARGVEWCSRFVAWGDDNTRLRQIEAYKRLRACNVWEFQYRDIGSAVARLDDLIHTGR
jgi:hypothetical protein